MAPGDKFIGMGKGRMATLTGYAGDTLVWGMTSLALLLLIIVKFQILHAVIGWGPPVRGVRKTGMAFLATDVGLSASKIIAMALCAESSVLNEHFPVGLAFEFRRMGIDTLRIDGRIPLSITGR